jgi:hypothetical protein
MGDQADKTPRKVSIMMTRLKRALKGGTSPFSTAQLETLRAVALESKFDEAAYEARCQRMVLALLQDIPDDSSDEVYTTCMEDFFKKLPPAQPSGSESEGEDDFKDFELEDQAGKRRSRSGASIEATVDRLRNLLRLRYDDAAKLAADAKNVDFAAVQRRINDLDQAYAAYTAELRGAGAALKWDDQRIEQLEKEARECRHSASELLGNVALKIKKAAKLRKFDKLSAETRAELGRAQELSMETARAEQFTEMVDQLTVLLQDMDGLRDSFTDMDPWQQADNLCRELDRNIMVLRRALAARTRQEEER